VKKGALLENEQQNQQYAGFSLDIAEPGVTTIRFTTPERLGATKSCGAKA